MTCYVGDVGRLARGILVGLLLMASTASGAEEHFFDSDGVKIRYTVEGEGPPVLLIHGFTASGDLNWRLPKITELLAEDYRVITIDNRGHGRSDKPTDVEAYGANMAHDALRLLDHLDLPAAHFVGYSMGGMITMKAAAIAPERVLSAVVGGMGWVEHGPARESVEEREGLAQPLMACVRAFPQLGITRDELAELDVPMVIIIGDEDSLLERRVEPLREVRPDIPVEIIPGANHITCIFRPEFRQAIKAFLDKQVAESDAGGNDSSPRGE